MNTTSEHILYSIQRPNFWTLLGQNSQLPHPPPPLPSKSDLKLVCDVNLCTETSSRRTLKIMPRNINETVRSWIWLPYLTGAVSFAPEARGLLVEDRIEVLSREQPPHRFSSLTTPTLPIQIVSPLPYNWHLKKSGIIYSISLEEI